ncbi:hypothetical protein [Massilia endophytica]|uniref:hypothetical protein n=1 Tax=Massilia endophytica TaxID=2899220 RepID=UPI001E387B04|nr:hypothetical protein [Massilia endophytica]UGQ45960.1 hypothetical protein LSQ66_19565 [Massilia endophytica]
MKSKYVRAGAGLLCAALLAACGGGGNDNLLLSGSVSGLTKPGLVLQNGDQTTTVGAGATSFYFPNLIAPDSQFDVKIKTDATASTCTVHNGSGKANYYNTQSQVSVTCVTDSYQLGGTVTGLDVNGLVLANGSATVPLTAGQTSFTFSTKVFDGANYGVTVLAQPPGRVCTVSNGVGTMPSGDVLNVAVSCQPAA